jgi:N-acetylglutamate synthase-like GNAT family acetyltransferase
MIRIRPATAADLKTITAIIRAAQINPMDLKWPNFALAVDEASGAVVGTGQIKRHSDGSFELASIATIPSHQRQGIAHQIIQYLVAQHAGPLYLTCVDTMGPFYEPFGFRELAEAEFTPHFRRLARIAATFNFLSHEGRRLLVMKRD